MREKTPQDYANELLRMYRENAHTLQELNRQGETPLPQTAPSSHEFEDGTGGLQVKVTTLSRLYPVPNAFITVFTGASNNKTVVETDTTDESGLTGIFNLKTPPKSESQQISESGDIPYANYNISVKSDGYVEQIIMNVPVFSGVVSVQNIDILPIAAAGNNTRPQITNEENNYNL